MVSEPVLRIEGLVKTFGAFRALDELTLEVRAGEILGLVGPNGSGKTTCINVVSGLYPPNGGRVLLGERSVGGLRPHKLVHQGVNRTFQIPKPFMQLTAKENVAVARAYGASVAGGPSVGSLLRDLNLEGCADRPAIELNSAQQKMLDLARALATGPRLLLVDELAAGFNPAELDWVAAKLRVLARAGMAIIVVEHLMGFIEQVTDRVVVMNAGREIFGGTLAQAVQEPRVIEVFLGKSHGESHDKPHGESPGSSAGASHAG